MRGTVNLYSSPHSTRLRSIKQILSRIIDERFCCNCRYSGERHGGYDWLDAEQLGMKETHEVRE